MPTRSRGFRKRGIIANPNCSTAQLVVALKPLHDRGQDQARGGRDLSVGLRRRQGRDGRAVRPDQGVFVARRVEPKKFPKRIAFNVIPHIDVFMEDGYTKEEWKMVVETKKILDPEDQAHRHLRARAGLHRPFRSGQHRVREADHAPTRRARSCATRRAASSSTSASRAATSRRYEAAGEDATYISRIREDATVENGLSMWVVSDNLRKGAALNAIQIAETLIKRKLITAKRKAA